jgi:hypothetical protein
MIRIDWFFFQNVASNRCIYFDFGKVSVKGPTDCVFVRRTSLFEQKRRTQTSVLFSGFNNEWINMKLYFYAVAAALVIKAKEQERGRLRYSSIKSSKNFVLICRRSVIFKQ